MTLRSVEGDVRRAPWASICVDDSFIWNCKSKDYVANLPARTENARKTSPDTSAMESPATAFALAHRVSQALIAQLSIDQAQQVSSVTLTASGR